MNEYNINIGIDVAKNHLDVCILPSGKTKRFKNNELGIISLIEFIGNKEQVERIILEPTGGYEELVLEMLSEKNYKISLVNAAQIRAFARANGILAKTDKIDAKVLADYGIKIPSRLYVPLSSSLKQLRKYVQRRRQLLHMIVEEKNRLKKERDSEIIILIKETLEYLNKQKDILEQRIIEKIEADKQLKCIKEVLVTMKGIGCVTAAVLMCEVPELGKLSHNQIAKLIGVAPINRESGMMRGKSKIYGGRGYVRDSLYLAALPAIRFEPILRDFYLRLKNNGKPGKLAVIAVVHKMISILNARLAFFIKLKFMNWRFFANLPWCSNCNDIHLFLQYLYGIAQKCSNEQDSCRRKGSVAILAHQTSSFWHWQFFQCFWLECSQLRHTVESCYLKYSF